jgi:menaquinone-9 beta-reductase
MRKHDVIVIGGSLAGAACVRDLVRLGIDVIAFERDRFPRAKVCGGFVSPGGVQCLDQLGLLDQVRNAGATTVGSATVRVDDVEMDIPFPCAGLGISRTILDDILARHAAIEQGIAVTKVARTNDGFVVSSPAGDATCSASGKLSRLSRRTSVDEFGVQFSNGGTRPGMLDFWFFEDGYGGGVTVEGGAGNYCFLINKDKLAGYLGRAGCLVTGPLGYDRVPGEFIAIGDAAGMVDPFCGEGMRHALDTGMTAARVVARGLRWGRSYEDIRREYEFEWARRWERKRFAGAVVRRLVKNRKLLARGLRLNPVRFLNWMWANGPLY